MIRRVVQRIDETIRDVLVVDDDDVILSTWRRSIQRTRTVRTAATAEAALELAREQAPDLAIIDLRLGDESGLELVQTLRRECPSTSIALYSGYLSVSTAVAGVRAGADAVVFKPITFEEILNELSGGSYDAAALAEVPTLARAEWEHISRVLMDSKGNLSLAARRLGIYRSSLQRKLRKYAPRK